MSGKLSASHLVHHSILSVVVTQVVVVVVGIAIFVAVVSIVVVDATFGVVTVAAVVVVASVCVLVLLLESILHVRSSVGCCLVGIGTSICVAGVLFVVEIFAVRLLLGFLSGRG